MKILGYIFVGIIIFFIGYGIGTIPSEEEETTLVNQQQAGSDIATVGDKYNYLYTLCEQKYQSALNGDVYGAVRINGQMDGVVAEIERLLAKYQIKAL